MIITTIPERTTGMMNVKNRWKIEWNTIGEATEHRTGEFIFNYVFGI